MEKAYLVSKFGKDLIVEKVMVEDTSTRWDIVCQRDGERWRIASCLIRSDAELIATLLNDHSKHKPTDGK